MPFTGPVPEGVYEILNNPDTTYPFWYRLDKKVFYLRKMDTLRKRENLSKAIQSQGFSSVDIEISSIASCIINSNFPLCRIFSAPDDSTKLLMTEFYKNLQHNPDKAQALRQAMLKTIQQQYDRPVKWAAFTLIGEAE